MALSAAIVAALQLPPHPCIAFVGAGGKTTAMFEMARAMAPAIVTTTTHLGESQSALADGHVVWTPDTPCDDLRLDGRGSVVLLTGPFDRRTRRLPGLTASQWYALRRRCVVDGRTLLAEADGSRQRPLKAPADHEPAIPQPVDAVIVVVGMLGCGLPLDDEHVHRPVRFSAISGCPLGDPVSPEAMAAALAHPEGGLKSIPPGVKRAVVLNQADTPDLRDLALRTASLLRPAFGVVAVASFRNGVVEIL